jgi:hypothetical protein
MHTIREQDQQDAHFMSARPTRCTLYVSKTNKMHTLCQQDQQDAHLISFICFNYTVLYIFLNIQPDALIIQAESGWNCSSILTLLENGHQKPA